MHVIMVAAENDALNNGKVGGIGDVLRDISLALATRQVLVTTLQPAYGAAPSQPGARYIGSLSSYFRGEKTFARVWRAPGRLPHASIDHILIDHDDFAPCGTGNIYCNDPACSPFATDATKFALFCVLASELIVQEVCRCPDVIHLHDWHAALLLFLRRYDDHFKNLQDVRTVFSVHNLAIQGTRPLSGHPSSLATWYQGLQYDIAAVVDPRWSDCINPMAIGVRLADAVHVVSPTYAREVQSSSDPDNGYFGGEGLEDDLRAADDSNRLYGILNGVEYSEETEDTPEWPGMIALCTQTLFEWIGQERHLLAAHHLAGKRLKKLGKARPEIVLTSVSRVTNQKVGLLSYQESGASALEDLLEVIQDNGVYIFLGAGDETLEQFLTHTMAQRDNFLFLRGYSRALAKQLYALGDLFLMPSLFEPCGISQMLAMKAGQPCLVHEVGGLRDTISDDVNGFSFSGDTMSAKSVNFIARARDALETKQKDPIAWQRMRHNARQQRFMWRDSIDRYISDLYCGGNA